MLRREYLNQTFQFLPEVAADYSSIVHDAAFEEEQRSLFLLQGTELTDEDTDEDSGMKNELFNDNLQINFLFYIKSFLNLMNYILTGFSNEVVTENKTNMEDSENSLDASGDKIDETETTKNKNRTSTVTMTGQVDVKGILMALFITTMQL